MASKGCVAPTTPDSDLGPFWCGSSAGWHQRGQMQLACNGPRSATWFAGSTGGNQRLSPQNDVIPFE
ncbi:hypothetical protein GGTG_11184 [Gaeumannomyces tritici R3-111a-1]|uniref:Uncharacterized protein n=1 Tax=Gaeumannomyces tritici (strain R3-111a-1) TaxID=644352 RepID=J3PCG2_GAET3|nr:hypothetical protein GGTG_11184 [Gaeumannomyces tritici R3-111a-1]EJT71932.1 hypothetical protein GGTG_11184 [Gaeumannomyces tritici R3-111a-1]